MGEGTLSVDCVTAVTVQSCPRFTMPWLKKLNLRMANDNPDPERMSLFDLDLGNIHFIVTSAARGAPRHDQRRVVLGLRRVNTDSTVQLCSTVHVYRQD